jgi:apolipoprotein D and lipocalin family protein
VEEVEMIKMLKKRTLLFLVLIGFFTALFLRRSKTPISREQIVKNIDIEAFSGDWYVVANIPTFLEKGAHNAIERYSLREDGDLDINFTYRKGSAQGEKKTFTGRMFVHHDNPSADWQVQFFWPVKFTYLVLDLAPDYRYTVIGVPNRKYVWIMSRTPSIEENDMQRILTRLAKLGYDTRKIQKVQQHWDDKHKKQTDG